MIFYKTVSSGNDFIHINVDECSAAGDKAAHNMTRANLAQKLCKRQTGAGADGVVFYKIPDSLDFVDFEIFNRDGSEAELSGNGMAGLAAVLFYLHKFNPGDDVVLNTKAGRKRISYLHHAENKFRLKIEIGIPGFQDSDSFPFLQANSKKDGSKDEYFYEGIGFYPVSVGNPHAVVVLEENVPDEKLEQLGKKLGYAPIFPHKANVEFVIGTGGPADYEGGEHFRIVFYERGVGRTLASSTGSAAVFAVLQKLESINDTLIIPGAAGTGENVNVSGKKKAAIYIENSTEIVYKGIYLNVSGSK